jgi:hypothetical protein
VYIQYSSDYSVYLHPRRCRVLAHKLNRDPVLCVRMPASECKVQRLQERHTIPGEGELHEGTGDDVAVAALQCDACTEKGPAWVSICAERLERMRACCYRIWCAMWCGVVGGVSGVGGVCGV